MPPRATPINPIPLMVLAAAALIWAVIGIAFAATGPRHLVPHLFYSYHIEHFLAFYAFAFLGAAALPAVRLHWLWLGATAFAAVLAVARAGMAAHRPAALEDFFCDAGGAAAALAPILVGRLRDAYMAAERPNRGR